MNTREQIEHCKQTVEIITQRIDKYSDYIKDIEWVGECNACDNGWVLDRVENECVKCNGTGKITRPATIEEVLEAMVGVLDHINMPIMDAAILRGAIKEQALTINNGRLRIKDKP